MDKTPVQKMYFLLVLASKHGVSSFIHPFVYSFTLRTHQVAQEWRGGSKFDKTGPEQLQKGLTTAKRYQRGKNPVWGERAKHGLRDRRGYSRAAQHSPWAHEKRLKNCRREETD